MTVILSRHIIEAQRRVARRHNLNPSSSNAMAAALTPPAPRWYEVEPHCSNEPLWTIFVVRAIEELAWKRNVEPAWLRSRAATSPAVADEIVNYAAAILHEFSRCEVARG